MNQLQLWSEIFLLLLATYNMYGTFHLLHSSAYMGLRKVFMFFVIWALPIVGCVFVMHLIKPSNVNPFSRYTSRSITEGQHSSGNMEDEI